MIGKKKLKKPETAGGRTPDAMANVFGEASAHDSKKGTYALIYSCFQDWFTFNFQKNHEPNPDWQGMK